MKKTMLITGAALAALLSLSAATEADGPKKTAVNGAIIKKLIKLAPDLAAVNITGSFVGDPTAGTAKFVMIGHVKNVGAKAHNGYRWAVLQYRTAPAGAWQHAATRFITHLAAGQSFYVQTNPLTAGMKLPSTQWRLVISQGDYNPGNDIYYTPRSIRLPPLK